MKRSVFGEPMASCAGFHVATEEHQKSTKKWFEGGLGNTSKSFKVDTIHTDDACLAPPFSKRSIKMSAKLFFFSIKSKSQG
jgi:hypothetical protein